MASKTEGSSLQMWPPPQDETPFHPQAPHEEVIEKPRPSIKVDIVTAP